MRGWAGIGVLVGMVWLGGCKKPEASPGEAPKASPARDPMEITVTPELAQQIRVGEPPWESVAGTLRVAGRFEADEHRIARVSAPVTGRVTELPVMEGQAVQSGEVIARIHSTQLSEVQSGLLKALSERRVAERALERARRLLEAGVIGEAELQRREAEVQQANIELAGLRDQLRLLGFSNAALERLESSRAMNPTAQVVASIDGIVLDRRVTIGQVVQAAEVLCILADLSTLWLVADVPEEAAGAVEVGKLVEAEVPALPGYKIRGKIDFVSATVNPETRTVRIRMDIPNARRRLKPAMLATVVLTENAERQRVLPPEAIVRESNQDYIFVQTSGRTFRLRRVSLGLEMDGRRVLIDGLQPGEKIVLDGAFHLNNERKRLALQGNS
jgi:cobalt-zinc-cadmium efflux system membrane fusion protein